MTPAAVRTNLHRMKNGWAISFKQINSNRCQCNFRYAFPQGKRTVHHTPPPLLRAPENTEQNPAQNTLGICRIVERYTRVHWRTNRDAFVLIGSATIKHWIHTRFKGYYYLLVQYNEWNRMLLSRMPLHSIHYFLGHLNTMPARQSMMQRGLLWRAHFHLNRNSIATWTTISLFIFINFF